MSSSAYEYHLIGESRNGSSSPSGISHLWTSKKVLCLVTITAISSLFYINILNTKEYVLMTVAKYTLDNPNKDDFNISFENSSGYLVKNPKCRIPDLKFWNEDVKRFVKLKPYLPCASLDPLTYVQSYDNYSILSIDTNMIHSYAPKGHLKCCYSVINRDPLKSKLKPDNEYNLTECTYFNNETQLKSEIEFIYVKCNAKNTKKVSDVYNNMHAMVPMKDFVRKRIDSFDSSNEKRPINVAFIGIDSISRLNFYRTMASTAIYLKVRGWIELRGYNKMDDNTYPNLMSIFTGFNSSLSYGVCHPTTVGALDKCPLIFYNFSNSGYVTAFGEDEEKISTFNYEKKGFNKQPTDYYLRPYLLAAQDKLKSVKVNGMNYCLGGVTTTERVLNYAHDFFERYKNDPFFGFFWLNNFSHQDVSQPSMLDKKIKNWFEKVEETGLFNTSIVIFLSDHGIRFGEIRETHSGWLEERLPFIHIWLPEWFREMYPEAAENLSTNSNRFTTPYDIHMTLQDILIKSGRQTNFVPSKSCPTCKSLFELVPFSRSCEDVPIDLHWCTCYGFQKMNPKLPIVKNITNFFVSEINNIINSDKKALSVCAKVKLDSVINIRKSSFFAQTNETLYLLVVTTKPGAAKFETTIRHNYVINQFTIEGSVSRINSYKSHSSCVHSPQLKKYCYCK